MRSASEEFKNALYSDDAGRWLIQLDIYNSDGSTIIETLMESDIWNNGIKIDTATSSDNSFDIGSAIIGKLSFVIHRAYDQDDYTQSLDYYGRKCVLYLGLDLPSGASEYVRIGTYNIVDIKYNTALTTFTAYDNLYLFDRDYSESNLVYPATCGEIVRDACSCCGVSLGTASFGHDDYIVNKRPEKVTFREILSYVGQITCHYLKCSDDGKLIVGWYSSASDHFDQVSSYSREMAMQPVSVTGVKLAYQQTSADSTDAETEVKSGTDGYVVTIEKNPLVAVCSKTPQEICDNLLSALAATPVFTPGKMVVPANPLLETGDIVGYWNKKQAKYIYDSIATGISFEIGTRMQIRCGGDTSVRTTAAQYSATTKNEVFAFDLIKSHAAYEKTEREKAVADLSDKVKNSAGLYTTKETDGSGGTVYYLHDKPTLAGSKIVWKMTSEAWAVSTDGGKTWNAGVTVDGTTITKILNAVGINADWINAGSISANRITGGTLKLGGKYNGLGKMQVYGSSDELQGEWGWDGIWVNELKVISTIGDKYQIKKIKIMPDGIEFYGDDGNIYTSIYSGGLDLDTADGGGRIHLSVAKPYYKVGDKLIFQYFPAERGEKSGTLRDFPAGTVCFRDAYLYTDKTVMAHDVDIAGGQETSITTDSANDQLSIRTKKIECEALESFTTKIKKYQMVGNYKSGLYGETLIDIDTDSVGGKRKISLSLPVVVDKKIEGTEYWGDSVNLDSDCILGGDIIFKDGSQYSNYNRISANGRMELGMSANLAVDYSLDVGKNLTVSGKKSRLASTPDYGDRFLYCYEMPTPYFGDVGEGVIGEDGQCYISIDAILSETIATDQYQVFLQAYGKGEAYIAERKANYFVVAGAPGLAFGWELKAKQEGFDQLRIDKAMDTAISGDTIDYGAAAADYVNSLEIGRKSATA